VSFHWACCELGCCLLYCFRCVSLEYRRSLKLTTPNWFFATDHHHFEDIPLEELENKRFTKKQVAPMFFKMVERTNRVRLSVCARFRVERVE
jgi:hypothetical protein